MQPDASAVQLSNISKRFGPVIALADVSVKFEAGRVHGLLGENGAGKTTLMNILYGLLRADSGSIEVGGQIRQIRTPHDAIAAGVGMVHQHFMLASAMSVLDNILLGDRRARQWLDRRGAAQRLREMSENLGLAIDPAARIDTLSVGQQQRVEILKALYRDVRILILDEPTAVLTPGETQQLFAAVNTMRSQGRGVVFISHKLREVREICDDLTVLRRGAVVWRGAAAGISSAELARHVVGHDVAPIAIQRAVLGEVDGRAPSSKIAPADEPGGLAAGNNRRGRSCVLELRNVVAKGLHDISLDIRAGEILGIAGVDGNGQQELAEAVVGLRTIRGGTVLFEGRDITALPLSARDTLGIAHVPNDRKREGLVASMSVAENIALKRHRTRPFSHCGILARRAMRRTAAALVKRFDVRTQSVETPVGTLSGGNQQKVILARELALTEPRLIVAMNPVRGLDIAATGFVYEQLVACRADGSAVLLISSELDELLALCDRIAVLYNGRLTLSGFPRQGAAEIGSLMTGGEIGETDT